MKVKECECGCWSFVACATDGTYAVMCVDNGCYSHKFGPSRKTKWQAIRAWNRGERKV